MCVCTRVLLNTVEFSGENLFYADLIFSIRVWRILRLRKLLSKSIFDNNNKHLPKQHILPVEITFEKSPPRILTAVKVR